MLNFLLFEFFLLNLLKLLQSLQFAVSYKKPWVQAKRISIQIKKGRGIT